MGGLSALAWRSLAARRLRTFLTVVGIALGVGVLFASLVTNAAIESSIERTVRRVVGTADLRVSAFQDRGLSAETVAAIRETEGVGVVAPAVERRAYLSAPSGGADRGPVTILGIDPAAHGLVHAVEIVEGAALSQPDEPSVVITEALARSDGYGLGSEIVLQAAGEPERFRVVGIWAGNGPMTGTVGRTVVVPIDAAMRVFGLEGVSRVDVRVDGVTADVVEARLVERLTAEPYVLSTPRDLAVSLRSSTSDFQATTSIIAGVALFVAAFLIFSTFSMTVAERMREIGLLRAAGAAPSQVRRFVLTGAIALGLMGSLVGLAVGFGFATLMALWIRNVGAVPLEAIELTSRAALLAVVVGVVVTVVAAMEPAWRASRVSPIEALKARADADTARLRGARLRWLVGIFGVVAVLGLLVWPQGAGGAIVRSLVVYAVLLVAALLSPFLLRPLGRIAGVPFAIVFRFEERLARGSLVRDRSRTALTVGALTVGLAMIVAIGGVAQNARQAATGWLVDVVPGDLVVTSIRPVALDEPASEALAGVEGVARVTPVGTFDIAYRGVRLDAAAIVGADVEADGRFRFTAGDRAAAFAAIDAGGAAILPVSQAEQFGLAVGDAMTFAVGSGQTVDLRVVGIVERGLPGATGETMLVGWRDATEAFGVAGADFFAVRFEPGAAATATPALEAVARTNALEPSTLGRIQGAVESALGLVFALFDALAIVAVIVAALGIVNTLTMNVVERVREIGVLRAAGMTRRQVGRMVLVEAGILGVVGAVLGGLAGIAVGAAMVVLAGGRLDVPADPPWSAIGLSFALGIGVSMLAAYYPARLAGRLSIVRALQFE